MGDPPTAQPQRAVAAGRRSEAGVGVSVLELARRVASGDDAAMGELYEARFQQVFLAARRATGGDESFCLDVVQECFLRVLRNRGLMGRLRDGAHVDRWLVCVAQRSALDLLRGERRRRSRETARANVGSSEASEGTISHQIEWLEKELGSLPSEDLALLRLRISGLTLDTVAEIVGSTTGAVHGRLRRLMAALGKSAKEADHG